MGPPLELAVNEVMKTQDPHPTSSLFSVLALLMNLFLDVTCVQSSSASKEAHALAFHRLTMPCTQTSSEKGGQYQECPAGTSRSRGTRAWDSAASGARPEW